MIRTLKKSLSNATVGVALVKSVSSRRFRDQKHVNGEYLLVFSIVIGPTVVLGPIIK